MPIMTESVCWKCKKSLEERDDWFNVEGHKHCEECYDKLDDEANDVQRTDFADCQAALLEATGRDDISEFDGEEPDLAYYADGFYAGWEGRVKFDKSKAKA